MTAQAQQGPWRTAEAQNEPMVADEGDVFTLLRHTRDKYYAAANHIVARRKDPETGILDSKYHGIVAAYRTSGDKVNALIPQEAHDAEPIVSGEPSVGGEEGSSTPSGNVVGQDLGEHQDSSEQSL